MFERLSRKRAQSILEYAILIGVITGALITMQIYLKRGYQGKLKESADSMGWQFSPGTAITNSSINTISNTTEDLANGTTTTQIINQITNRSGTESIGAFNKEIWFEK